MSEGGGDEGGWREEDGGWLVDESGALSPPVAPNIPSSFLVLLEPLPAMETQVEIYSQYPNYTLVSVHIQTA